MSAAIFNPPLSTQRYCWVQNFISQDSTIKSVTDVGCGHGRLLIWLKHIGNLELVNCVDKSLATIEDGIEMCFQPNLYEMLFGRKNSEKPLDIQVFHGDIVVPDERLKADCFTMVELIEHLQLDHLEKVCQTVFAYYNPRFVIVTTPNSEFNHLLQTYSAAQKAKREQGNPISGEQMTDQHINKLGQTAVVEEESMQSTVDGRGAPKFRHYDHKFEWNRAEFADWTRLICEKYNYEVSISGVGDLPGSEALGPCTQIALFRRLENNVSKTGQILADPTLCFDLFLNKLSVQEARPEFLGDPTLRTICLRAQYQLPGTPASDNAQSNYSARWDVSADDEMASCIDLPCNQPSGINAE